MLAYMLSAPPRPCSAGPGHPVWQFGAIYRMSRDGTNIQQVASGVRNTVGFDWHPVTKKMYFTDNGRGEKSPGVHGEGGHACTNALGHHMHAPRHPLTLPPFLLAHPHAYTH